MEIKKLIELIVESTPSLMCPLFTFFIQDGKTTRMFHQSFGVDDAIAFLFDCDLKLWELVSYDVNLQGTTFWHITLMDTHNAIKNLKKFLDVPKFADDFL